MIPPDGGPPAYLSAALFLAALAFLPFAIAEASVALFDWAVKRWSKPKEPPP